VAPAGRVLLSADYAQMELRLMAHFSGDPLLVTMLRAPDQDPFRHWAAQWLDLQPGQVTTPPCRSFFTVPVSTAARGSGPFEQAPTARIAVAPFCMQIKQNGGAFRAARFMYNEDAGRGVRPRRGEACPPTQCTNVACR
jgi:hypothetical protein